MSLFNRICEHKTTSSCDVGCCRRSLLVRFNHERRASSIDSWLSQCSETHLSSSRWARYCQFPSPKRCMSLVPSTHQTTAHPPPRERKERAEMVPSLRNPPWLPGPAARGSDCIWASTQTIRRWLANWRREEEEEDKADQTATGPQNVQRARRQRKKCARRRQAPVPVPNPRPCPRP